MMRCPFSDTLLIGYGIIGGQGTVCPYRMPNVDAHSRLYRSHL
ncbi:MAG: hypothetical protein AAGD25_11305 [Cyanobacteria bacterium P01_F01_bin.150]